MHLKRIPPLTALSFSLCGFFFGPFSGINIHQLPELVISASLLSPSCIHLVLLISLRKCVWNLLCFHFMYCFLDWIFLLFFSGQFKELVSQVCLLQFTLLTACRVFFVKHTSEWWVQQLSMSFNSIKSLSFTVALYDMILVSLFNISFCHFLHLLSPRL